MPSYPAESSSAARIGPWRRVLSLWPPSKHEDETEDHPLLDRHTPTSPHSDTQGFLSSIFGSSSGTRTGSRGIFSPPTRTAQAWSDSPVDDPPDYSGVDGNEDEDADEDDPGDTSTAAAPLPPPNTARRRTRRFDPVVACTVFISVGWTVGVFLAYPFPTTIHIFIGILVFLFGWTLSNWVRLLISLGTGRKNAHLPDSIPGKAVLALASILVIMITIWGFRIPVEDIPDLPTQKYFIGANLHNNEEVLGQWSEQLERLIFHLGRENVFVSIYESNSVDKTKTYLETLNHTLSNLHIDHRIIATSDDRRWWPYATSPERIQYLAQARNKVLDPLQSPDPAIRLENYQDFDKVIFLNDVLFQWDDLVRLIATRVRKDDDGRADGKGADKEDDVYADEYDMACGIDFGLSGLYDTWVARDICGTPLRPFWPYTDDSVSVDRLRANEPFAVSACWNGVVVFQAGPYKYRPQDHVAEVSRNATSLAKRGWKMVDDDTYPGSVSSPELTLPLKFRASGIQACDHSECFLWSYDLHRLYNDPARPPRIYMNPGVQVAYEDSWFRWHHTVLRRPVIKFWVDHWSRGLPFKLVGWLWRHIAKRRDYCTWAALAGGMPARCPPLPGPADRSWNAR